VLDNSTQPRYCSLGRSSDRPSEELYDLVYQTQRQAPMSHRHLPGSRVLYRSLSMVLRLYQVPQQAAILQRNIHKVIILTLLHIFHSIVSLMCFTFYIPRIWSQSGDGGHPWGG